MSLPAHATEASHKRYQLAVQLVQSCPPELGEEIALTGSTARRLADDDSDLELNLWSETLPPIEARVAWLEAAGVEEIEVFERPRPDDSYWIGGKLDGVPLEIGWQTYDTVEEIITKLLLRQAEGQLGDILVTALRLRTQGKIKDWQTRLNAYSDVVQKSAIRPAVRAWSQPNHFRSMYKLAQRNERLSLIEIYALDLSLLMSVLYAINRRWEPNSKWTLAVARELPLMPENWRERIEEVLTAPLEESVYLCVELMLDALALVPPEYDVSAAVAALQEAKRSVEKGEL